MYLKGLRYVFCSEAGDGSGGGGSGGGSGGEGAGGEGGAQGVGEGGAAVGDGGAGGAGGNVLGQGQGEGGQGQGAQTLAIPEKFQVKKEDGTVDFEASGLKMAEAYSNLEKRVGSGDVPPKSAAEYEVKVPDALKEHWKPTEDPLLQAFLGKAHSKGLNQAQLDLVMESYFEIAPALVGGAKQLSYEDCTKDLQAEWKTPEQYDAELKKSFRALSGYAGKDAEGLMSDYGNDPRFIRMLNRMGAEMGEDSSVSGDGTTPSEESEINALMASKAYTDAKDPKHAEVSAKVKAYFDKKSKGADALAVL